MTVTGVLRAGRWGEPADLQWLGALLRGPRGLPAGFCLILLVGWACRVDHPRPVVVLCAYGRYAPASDDAAWLRAANTRPRELLAGREAEIAQLRARLAAVDEQVAELRAQLADLAARVLEARAEVAAEEDRPRAGPGPGGSQA